MRSREVMWSGSIIAIMRFSLRFSSPNRKANDHLQRLALKGEVAETKEIMRRLRMSVIRVPNND